MEIWVLRGHFQILHHRVDVQNTDEGEETEATEPASLAEDSRNGEKGVAVSQFGGVAP